MSYNTKQFKEFISLVLSDLQEDTGDVIVNTEEAQDLLFMTAAHESHLGTYLKQVKGPACGAFQMEPLTHEDHWNYITARKWLYNAMAAMNLEINTEASEMTSNLKYAVVMARIHYYRKPEALPKKAGNPRYLEELGEYAKKHYNTVLGKATAKEYLDDYIKYN